MDGIKYCIPGKGIMMKSWIEGLTIAAFLTLMVFAVPQDAMAGTVTVPAPKETASIHLGVKDPPASAYLFGWYCSKTKKMEHDVGVLRWRVFDALGKSDPVQGAHSERGYPILQAARIAYHWKLKFLDKGWPFKLAGMRKNTTEKGLDAPPGGRKVYKFKYCYTANELKMIHDKVKQWVALVQRGGNVIVGKEPDYALSFFGGLVDPNPNSMEGEMRKSREGEMRKSMEGEMRREMMKIEPTLTLEPEK